VAIGHLERYVADYEREIGNRDMPENLECNGKKVAVVGSGPGGLTCAADLVAKGYEVTVFEAFHEAGGVLKYGIPEFRLPKEIVQNEIDYLKEMGCRIELNYIIGNIYTLEELRDEFDAVYIGVGAGLPRFLNIEGENLNYVMSANEYLTRINLMKAYKFPEVDTPLPHGDKITVVGGGNVAMDSARSALRSGAKSVTVVYRRSREEMPARNDEIVHAEEEGVNFVLLSNPVRLIGDRRGRVKSMECQKMRLSEPDGSGRRKPIPIEGHNFFLDTDLVIIAVGTNANPLIFRTSPELKRNKWGYIEVDPGTMETSMENVYAGGDIVTGSATVIQAMGAGRKAASAIHHKLSGGSS
jgi:glutamate synthase (NADPH/NADH) small chain